MAIPSPVKIKKDGVEYISNVDRVQYTIKELVRAALRDCGKLITKRTRQRIKKRTGKGAKYTQYWVRKKTCDLQVGFKPTVFYLGFAELGTGLISKIGFLQDTVLKNISEMREIQGKYLSAIENENKALGMIEESDYGEE